jgi:hypothetical protein
VHFILVGTAESGREFDCLARRRLLSLVFRDSRPFGLRSRVLPGIRLDRAMLCFCWEVGGCPAFQFYIFALTRSDIDDLEVKVWTSANTALYDIVLGWHASFVT